MPDKTASERLLGLFETLDKGGQQALLDYALFLQQRYLLKPAVSAEPLPIERPDGESVIASIKRLRETYPMLDTESLLHDTSQFMMQHVMQGREAQDVIDDLEDYFAARYDTFSQRKSNVSDT